MDVVLHDLRFAARALARRPGFTIVAVVTLALGIGATTTVFSTVYGLLMRPLPFDEGNRLILIQGTYPGLTWFDAHCSYANFLDLKSQSTTLEHLAAYEIAGLNYTSGDRPERITAVKATSDIFRVLEVQPLLGRLFGPDEDRPGMGQVVLLAEGFWRSRLGADPDIIGRDLAIHDDVYRVVGIVPMTYEQSWTRSDVWMPLGSSAEDTSRHDNNLRLIGRRTSRANVAQVNAELATVMQRIEDAYPLLNGGRIVRARSAGESRLADDKVPAIKSLTVAVAIVLLIACANVANLMLVRGTSRHKELAVRAALGAGRGRIVRQLLTESVVVALLAGGLGAVIAHWGISAVAATQPAGVVSQSIIRMDILALFFTLLLSLATVAIFGLAPAWRASRVPVAGCLNERGRAAGGGRRSSRLRSTLIVGEIGLALVLLTSAGLMIQSVLRLQAVDVGFNAEDLLTMRVSLPDYQYREPQRQSAFYASLLEELERIPQVTSAAVVDAPPFVSASVTTFGIEGRPRDDTEGPLFVGRLTASSDYWRTFQIPIVSGRWFLPRDDADAARVVVVNRAMADRYWPSEDPVGKRVNFGGQDESSWRTVVGVVADDLHWELKGDPRPEVTVPFRQMPDRDMFVVMRTEAANPQLLAGTVREAVRRVDPNQPVYGFRTMSEYVDLQVSPWRAHAWVLTLFSAVALTLATVGIYSVMSYVVRQRTHEIGIRIALGARARDVSNLVLRQAALLTACGLTFGVLGALVAGALLSGMLYGIGSTDPATLLGVAVLLAAAAMIAGYIPARRATKVDPMVALRCE